MNAMSDQTLAIPCVHTVHASVPKRQASHAWVSQEMKQSSAGKQHCVRPLHSVTIYTMAVQLCG